LANRVSNRSFIARVAPVNALIIKTETYDPDLALEIVKDQRNRGYNAWIEDESGAAVDEQSLKTNGRVATKSGLFPEWLRGPLFISGYIAAGLVVLYVVGLLIDQY
jgi:hypothetical protein